jgi:hypothetical protein
LALEQLLGYERFWTRRKDRLRQTEQPNALPASWRCPGQHKGAVGGSFTLNARIVFGHGCDHPSYVALVYSRGVKITWGGRSGRKRATVDHL